MKRIYLLILLALPAIACTLTQIPSAITTAKTITPRTAQEAPQRARIESHEQSPTPPAIAAIVNAGKVNLRACAGTSCKVIKVLEAGQAVTITTEQTITPDGGQWIYIRADDFAGWINKKFLNYKESK